MGSSAVAIMAGDDLAPGARKLHPFFTAQRTGSTETLSSNVGSAIHDIQRVTPEVLGSAGEDDNESETDSTGPRQKRENPDLDEEQAKPEKRRRRRPRQHPPALQQPQTTIAKHFRRQNQDPLPPTDCASKGCDDGKAVLQREEHSPTLAEAPESSLNVDKAGSSNLTDGNDAQNQTVTARPKRMLRFNPKTGTIGSPPKRKESTPDVREDTKSTKKTPSSSKNGFNGMLKIKYGEDDESRRRIGARIDAILTAPQAAAPPTPTRPQRQLANPGQGQPAVQNADAAKDTHPFFLNKPQQLPTVAPAPVIEKSPVKAKKGAASRFTSTPCSPKKPRLPQPVVRMPQFGFKNGGLKVPGSTFPAWPWMGIAHVRDSGAPIPSVQEQLPLPLSLRKSKGHAVHIETRESVLEDRVHQLNLPKILDILRNTNSEEFQPPPTELRLPQKHFESGLKLQHRISPQLSKRCPASSPLFDSIQTSLSAFDRSECENLSWSHKYAPTCAADVIQPGKEPLLLREWLRALQVRSVDTGPSENAGSSSKRDSAKKEGNAKRRKRPKLEGFVVSSDEESDGMDELSESDTDWSPSGYRGVAKRTVIRAGDTATMRAKNGARLTNAVVVSGPHGCGKTATVYAIAKELGFEVFEINPGSRRGGKEILEKIGDMTRNHLVHHHESAKSAPEADAISDAEVSKDIISGKQATMNSFFRTKAPAKKAPSVAKPATAQPTPTETKKAVPKAQKQSLILLEEVDILYQDDKQFWTTVMGLIIQSKRPFIITCNDETLLPLQSLRLHGIFRFASPPQEAAVDRLVMIAANEGHSLDRIAVDALFASHHADFRATLMDLNFWCQTGVGDRRGGFDWFYPRWPRGVDLDEDGRVVRVVSDRTYQEGMGWLDRDLLLQHLSPQRLEEELMQRAWTDHGVDVGDWHQSLDMAHWADSLGPAASAASRLALLEGYDDFASAMSLADIASSSAFATASKELLDATQPLLPSKIRDDFTIGLPLLEAPTVMQYESSILTLPISLQSMARRTLQDIGEAGNAAQAAKLAALREQNVVNCIRERSRSETNGTSRMDFALAFDPIAASDSSQTAVYLDPSIFDRNLEPIVLDVAPYVRGIVAYDAVLQKQRLKLSNLVSEGGRGTKRMRTTRAAMSALEGGQRSTTRKERWFKANLNAILVKETAGEGWAEAAAEAVGWSTTEDIATSSGGNSPPESTARRDSESDEDADELA